MRAITCAGLAVALLATAALGCSDAASRAALTEDEYAIALLQSERNVLLGVAEIREEVLTSPESDAVMEDMERLAVRLDDELDRLRDVEPPPRFKDYHEQQLTALGDAAAGLRRAVDLLSTSATALEQGDFERAFALVDEASAAVELEPEGTFGQEDSPVLLLLRDRSDPLAAFLVQANALMQEEASPNACDELDYAAATELSADEFDAVLRPCLEQALRDAEQARAAWQEIVPPPQAESFHAAYLVLMEDSIEEVRTLPDLSAPGQAPDAAGTDGTAAWMRLMAEWCDLAIVALSE